MAKSTGRNTVKAQDRDQFNSAIGLRVKSLRKAKRLTQEDLACWLGVTNPTFSAKERGAVAFSGHDIQILCNKLNTSPNFLFGWASEHAKREAEIRNELDRVRRKMNDYFNEIGGTGFLLDIERR